MREEMEQKRPSFSLVGQGRSYGEALSVLSEYVETELSHPKEQTQKKKARNVHER